MKKFVIPLVTAIIVAILIFAGCAKPAPAPAPAPAAATEFPYNDLTTAADIVGLEELIAKGSVNPELKMNPFGVDFAVKPDGTPYRFAYTWVLLGIDTLSQADNEMNSYIRRAGGEYISFNPALDAQKQIGFIEDTVSLGTADAIILHAVNEALLATASTLAEDSGIPVFNVDIETHGKKTTYVHHKMEGPLGSDVVGQFFVDKANELGYTEANPLTILEVWIERAMENSQLRHQGFRLPIDQADNIVVIESVDSFHLDENTANIVMDNFTAYPELKGLYVQGGGGAGGIEGLRSLGILVGRDEPDHVWVALNDTGTSEVKEVDAGRVDAFSTHCHQDMWDMVTQLAFWNVVLGQPVPEEVILPMNLVAFENIDTPLVWGNPVYPRLPTGQWDLWPVCNFRLAPVDMGVDYPTKALRMELQGY